LPSLWLPVASAAPTSHPATRSDFPKRSKNPDGSKIRRLASAAIRFASGTLLARMQAAGDFSARQLDGAPEVKILRLGPALFLFESCQLAVSHCI
jgi:hypothetical protein